MPGVQLHDGWWLTAADGPDVPAGVAGRRIPATVPGCVHTDLLAAGLIPDPFADRNETGLGWIGRTDWRYRTAFDRPAAADRADWSGQADLEFDGLDTVATVSLNGVQLGRTANMHRRYRWPVGQLLRSTGNQLTVRFGSAYRHAEAVRAALGDRPGAYAEPYNFIRKTACNFGWDWGPTLVTAGIWRPVRLRTWSTARLGTVRPLVTVAGGDGRVIVHAEVERAGGEAAGRGTVPLVLTVAVGSARAEVAVPAGQDAAVAELTVPRPALWWPRGHGEPARHRLTVELATAGGVQLDSWQRAIGFRTVELDTAADAHGSRFTVLVNGRPVFVRGANWIPEDVFCARVGPDRYAARLADACAANLNFLRVWGGGNYESEQFYELADQLGLMVGQDFAFACAAYPEEEPLYSEVAAEARDNVARLAGHPSLVLWTGNNECTWGWHDWGWRDQLAGRSWGAGYYLDLLPGIVAELDPTRPYWPASPYSGDERIHPNDPAHGSTHIWDVWNTDDYTRYLDYRPRFVAEFGYQAPAAHATLRQALSDDPLAPDSPGMRQHQKAVGGDLKLERGLVAHLPPPRDFDDWHYLTQVNQARAIRLGVEHFRGLRPLCMGTIVWQLNDCWPATSWSAVDSGGRRKPLWYALRAAYADRLLTLQPIQPIQPDTGGLLALVAVNDAGTPWSAPVEVTRVTIAGQPLAKGRFQVDVPAGSARTVELPAELAIPEDPRTELVVADVVGGAGAGAAVGVDGAERALHFFAEDRDIPYPAPDYGVAIQPGPDGLAVTVTARTIMRDLSLFPDRLDPGATVDRALVTLLPEESATFTVRTGPDPASIDTGALGRRPVLRCVNDVRP